MIPMTPMRRLFFVFPLVMSACGAPTTNPTPPPSSTPPTVASASVAPTPEPKVDPPQPKTEVAPPAPPAPPSIPTKELQVAHSIDVGKWPEGIALVGDHAWVAESGQRRLAKIDLQQAKVVAHVNVGRLPVNMVTGPDDTVYALEFTDQRVRAVNSKNAATDHSRLPDSPQHMVLEDNALWVLLWDKASSADSTVVRIDLKTKAQKRSPKLGPNAWQVAMGHDRVWVGHEARISVLDKGTLEKKGDVALSDGAPTEASPKRTTFGRVVAGPQGIYGDYNSSVVRVDPKELKVTHRAKLGQLPLYMATTTNDLWVATREGSIWQLDPTTLEVRAEHKLPSVAQFHDLKVRDGLLYVTDFPRPGATDDGRLLVLRPASTAPRP